jgi:hypothetical protein
LNGNIVTVLKGGGRYDNLSHHRCACRRLGESAGWADEKIPQAGCGPED